VPTLVWLLINYITLFFAGLFQLQVLAHHLLWRLFSHMSQEPTQ